MALAHLLIQSMLGLATAVTTAAATTATTTEQEAERTAVDGLQRLDLELLHDDVPKVGADQVPPREQLMPGSLLILNRLLRE